MKLRILLINPWIYDFAAVSLWSRPLGLLKVAERLSIYDVGLSLIDCTGSYPNIKSGKGKYQKEPVEKPDCLKQVPRTYGRYGIDLDEFRKRLSAAAPFDIVFITSIMSWWYPGVRKVIEIIREDHGNVPVVLGGIYSTLWHRHASETSGADFIHQGAVGEEIGIVFNTFGFRIRKTSDAATPYYRLGLYSGISFAPLLTGSGCPYRCAYCASRILQKGFSRKGPDEVMKEIIDLFGCGVRDFAFYDDALLADADRHIKIVLREVIRSGIGARFHCPNGLHARSIDEELAGLMSSSGFRTIRLGFETADERRQGETGGKVTSEDLARAVGHLKGQGFEKKDIGVYLMYGLPGQGMEEVKRGVRFLKSLGVTVHLTEFSPIPGTASWHELETQGVVRDTMDPLLTNNSVFSYLFSGYDPQELRELKLSVRNYNIS